METDQIQYWYGQKKKLTFRCEARLVLLCETFDSLWPHCTPAEGNRSSWYAGLRKILREFGERGSVQFLEYARTKIDEQQKSARKNGQQPLTIVDAHSICFMIPGFKQLMAGDGDHCPECGSHFTFCEDDWGSKRRAQKYGGE